MKRSIYAPAIALAILNGSPAMANPQDAINAGTENGKNLFESAFNEGAESVIKKAAKKVFGKVIGFGVGELIDSKPLGVGEDEAVRQMKVEWERQQAAE